MARKFKEVDPELLGPEFVHDEEEIERLVDHGQGLVKKAREEAKDALEGLYSIEHGAVLYSREGVTRLLRVLGVVRDDVWAERVAEASRVGPDWKRLRDGCRRAAVNLIPTNRSLVLAYLMDDKDGMTVRVNVGTNANFVVGMEMVVRCVGQPDLYELVGARPRARGRW